MPHIQSDGHLAMPLNKGAMSFIPWHRFFQDIYPFSRFDFDSRSDRQLSLFPFAQSASEMTASIDNEEGVWVDSHLNSSLYSTAE
jgi:hypothetical protein